MTEENEFLRVRCFNVNPAVLVVTNVLNELEKRLQQEHSDTQIMALFVG
jgi:hypothetical protein